MNSAPVDSYDQDILLLLAGITSLSVKTYTRPSIHAFKRKHLRNPLPQCLEELYLKTVARSNPLLSFSKGIIVVHPLDNDKFHSIFLID